MELINIALFQPFSYFKRITDISVEYLKSKEIDSLILDVDNTLTTHDNPVPLENLDKWIANMRNNGIKMIILSNNHCERVKPFADLIGIDFVYDGKKPLKSGFKRAINKMKATKQNTAVIGDQIFTDIIGANYFGIKGILLEPIELEKTNFFKLKRKLEIPVIKKYLRNNSQNR